MEEAARTKAAVFIHPLATMILCSCPLIEIVCTLAHPPNGYLNLRSFLALVTSHPSLHPLISVGAMIILAQILPQSHLRA